ncbi:MAG: hypothetical protein PHR09_00750 [Bacilli bacterium]|nr:hypothetical protein [Bacilli bacterium]
MKKNIILGISLFIISIILIIIKIQGTYIEGRVIDITYNKSNEIISSILLEANNEPYTVYFKNIDIQNISLNDIVKIKTTGVLRESYPVQADGLSIKKIRNNSIKLNDNNDDSINKLEIILYKSSYYDEEVSYKNKFKTKVLTSKTEFNEFIFSRNITIPNNKNIDNILDNNFAVVSYANMTSSGVVDFSGLYKEDNKMFIYVKINSGQIVTTDLVTRGVITFVPKEYINNTFETLSKYTIENN